MIGTRVISSDGRFQIQDVENCPFEKFQNSSAMKSFIKSVWLSFIFLILEQNLGEKPLQEVTIKVDKLIENKNKTTQGPSKD